MAPKRPHTKSRNGCSQCKRRRVKCDERGPPCGNCAARKEECQYSTPAPSRLPRQQQQQQQQHNQHQNQHQQQQPLYYGPSAREDALSPLSSTSAASSRTVTLHSHSLTASPAATLDVLPSPGSGLANASVGESSSTPQSSDPYPNRTRLRELELMHQWCTKTCGSFSAKLTTQMRDYCVTEALTHEYLMEAILALSALHLATELTDPDAAASYVSSALQYQNNAFSGLGAALMEVGPDNCDSIFATSVITMACAIVAPLLSTGDGDKACSPLESGFILYGFIRGLKTIVSIGREWLNQGPFALVFEHQGKPANPEQMRGPFDRLNRLNDTYTGGDPEAHRDYQYAISQLAIALIEDQKVIIPWLAIIGDTFTERLRAKEPMAKMICMHWSVGLDQLHELWWATFSGKRMVEELANELIGRGGDWDEAVLWAKFKVGL